MGYELQSLYKSFPDCHPIFDEAWDDKDEILEAEWAIREGIGMTPTSRQQGKK